MGTLETRCHSILNADETRVDRLFFLSALYSQGESLSFFELDGGVEDVDGVYRHIKQHLCSFLDCFNGAVLGITGFSLFTLKDLLAYLLDPTLFSLHMKKEKGKGVLYGLEHGAIRQSLINGLPAIFRKRIVFSKVSQIGILGSQKTPLGRFWGEDWSSFSQRVEVCDIGMGHSVYLISEGEEKWVLKENDQVSQRFFCELLSQLDLKGYQSYPFYAKDSSWLVLEYLGETTLGHSLSKGPLSDEIECQLAQQSALSDCLGHGDRHMENYILENSRIIPIDISFLFYEDNERWLTYYANAGMSEFSYYYTYRNDESVMFEKMGLFLKSYMQFFDVLRRQKTLVQECIRRFYPGELELKGKFFLSRVCDETYPKRQLVQMVNSFFEMMKRQFYKSKLSEIVVKDEQVFEHSLLKMYHHANKNRLSAFFLIDCHGRDAVFPLIRELAREKLGLECSLFEKETIKLELLRKKFLESFL